MSVHTATVPVSVQVGIKQITLTATVSFSFDPGAGVSDVLVRAIRDPDGDLWPPSWALAVWVEKNINRDELRASVDPAFAAERKAATDAFVYAGLPEEGEG
jgi:hypothetical protein